jgi:hypothetical protein
MDLNNRNRYSDREVSYVYFTFLEVINIVENS